jgi:hypothetical protein
MMNISFPGGTMISQTVYWILFTITLFIIMFLLIPPDHGPELSPFGFWMGLVQAFVVLYLGHAYLKLFNLSGDQTFLGIPLLTALSWVPPSILFAAYFPWANTVLKKAAYILAFASGTAAVQQFLLMPLGMWKNIHWSTFYTFLLAVVTHSIMTVYYLISNNTVRNK